MMNKLILLFTVLLFFVRCTYEKMPVYYLIGSKQVDIVADTFLLHNIKCLTFYGDEVYFSNPVYDQIFSLDKNLDLRRTIGKKGEGSNELLGISQFAISDSLISVLNVANRRINLFLTNGDIVTEKSITDIISFDPNYRYCFINEEIMGCSSVAETPLSKYNMYTKKQTLFGKTHEFPTPKQTSIRNDRFTVRIGKDLVVVSNNLPCIEIYNQDNLKQIVQYDYSDITQVKNSIRAIESKTDKTDNSYRHLCEDIYATNQYLYILLNDYSNNDFNVNQIIKFQIHPVIEPLALYKLPGKYYKTFCVSEEDNTVYAYHNTENTLGAYLINQ